MHSFIEFNAARMPRILCAVLVALAPSLTVSCSRSNDPKPKMGPYEGLGEGAALQACELLNDQGRVAVWIADTKLTGNPGIDRMFDHFRRTLKSHERVELAGVERIAVTGFGITADEFVPLFDKYRDADAIVSFVGSPQLTAAQIGNLNKQRPKIIAVDSFTDPRLVETLLARDVIQMAIVPKPAPSGNDPDPVTPDEWFERYYEIRRR